ncbi:unnamed protein product, partial [Prorocentrum cordatum]
MSYATPPGQRRFFFVAKGAVQRAIYHMELPPHLSRYFRFPVALRRCPGSKHLGGAEIGGRGCLQPLVYVMSTGWPWTSHFCQSALAEAIDAGVSADVAAAEWQDIRAALGARGPLVGDLAPAAQRVAFAGAGALGDAGVVGCRSEQLGLFRSALLGPVRPGFAWPLASAAAVGHCARGAIASRPVLSIFRAVRHFAARGRSTATKRPINFDRGGPMAQDTLAVFNPRGSVWEAPSPATMENDMPPIFNPEWGFSTAAECDVVFVAHGVNLGAAGAALMAALKHRAPPSAMAAVVGVLVTRHFFAVAVLIRLMLDACPRTGETGESDESAVVDGLVMWLEAPVHGEASTDSLWTIAPDEARGMFRRAASDVGPEAEPALAAMAAVVGVLVTRHFFAVAVLIRLMLDACPRTGETGESDESAVVDGLVMWLEAPVHGEASTDSLWTIAPDEARGMFRRAASDVGPEAEPRARTQLLVASPGQPIVAFGGEVDRRLEELAHLADERIGHLGDLGIPALGRKAREFAASPPLSVARPACDRTVWAVTMHTAHVLVVTFWQLLLRAKAPEAEHLNGYVTAASYLLGGLGLLLSARAPVMSDRGARRWLIGFSVAASGLLLCGMGVAEGPLEFYCAFVAYQLVFRLSAAAATQQVGAEICQAGGTQPAEGSWGGPKGFAQAWLQAGPLGLAPAPAG